MKILNNGYLEKVVNYKKGEISRVFAGLSSEYLECMCSEIDPARDFRSALSKKDEVAMIS